MGALIVSDVIDIGGFVDIEHLINLVDTLYSTIIASTCNYYWELMKVFSCIGYFAPSFEVIVDTEVMGWWRVAVGIEDYWRTIFDSDL